MSLINVTNLSFGYDHQNILQNINIQINERDFLVIIGPNGGGKSTFIKLLLGLLKPTCGSIQMDQENISLGYVPQNTNINLAFPITAIDVVLMGYPKKSKIFFKHPKEHIQKTNELLQLVGIEESLRRNLISSLSGGQRQRVMIARALFSDPKILILDEPTASIDAIGQKQIFELLKKLNENMTIIVVSHDISVALDYASSLAYINQKLSYHKSSPIETGNFVGQFRTKDQHFCEIEMMQMLKKGLL